MRHPQNVNNYLPILQKLTNGIFRYNKVCKSIQTSKLTVSTMSKGLQNTNEA